MASLNEMLEDEILLALPLVNYHEDGSVLETPFFPRTGAVIRERDEIVADNPFNILQQLKK